MTGVMLVALVIGVTAGSLLLVHVIDKTLDETFPNYSARWEAAFGESETPRSHVTSGVPCIACGRVGAHEQGCGRLDRLDAGMRG